MPDYYSILWRTLKTGDVDLSHYLPAKDYASVKAGKEIILLETTGLGYSSMALNVRDEPFNKKELRQAFRVWLAEFNNSPLAGFPTYGATPVAAFIEAVRTPRGGSI